MIKKIKDSLKYIKIKDIINIFIFLLIIIPALIYKVLLKILHKNLYVICEDPNEACDNGYHLFKYIRINYPDDLVFYAIKKRSRYYENVNKYGNVIEFGSLRHWIYYIAAKKNISTHKYGNPAPTLFYVLHVYFKLFNNRVFLQHGVIMNDLKYLYYKNTRFKQFFCSAKPEYEFIKKEFGYPIDYIKCVGQCRFDNLQMNHEISNKIVIMPTWRSWLGRETNFTKKEIDFVKTDYYKNFSNLLNNENFINFIEKNNIQVYFYPHRNMQKYLQLFKINSRNIILADSQKFNIQELLNDCDFMITDYSSVSIDFAYMKKPLTYFQFDKENFRKQHLELGYFLYEKDGFGPVFEQLEDVIDYTIKMFDNNFKQEKIYNERCNDFFIYVDNNNCSRAYKYIKED